MRDYYDFFNDELKGRSIFHYDYGDDIDKFKNEYRSFMEMPGIEITLADDPLKLKRGFCVEYDEYDFMNWYTVSLRAWAEDKDKEKILEDDLGGIDRW